MKNFNTLQTQLEQAGLVQPKEKEIVQKQVNSFLGTMEEIKEQQAIMDMLTPAPRNCPKCNSTKLNRTTTKSKLGMTTYQYCLEPNCGHKSVRYELSPAKLLKMIKENKVPMNLTQEQRTQLAQMVLPKGEQMKTQEVAEPVEKREYIKKVKEIDLNLVNLNEETIELKKKKNYDLGLDKKVVYRFIYQNMRMADIAKELSISNSYVVYCFRRHKINYQSKHPVQAALVYSLSKKGKTYQDISKELNISIGHICHLKAMYNMSKNSVVKPVVKQAEVLVQTPKAAPKAPPQAPQATLSDKQVILQSTSLAEIETILKTTQDPVVKELAKQKMRLILECI